MSTASVKHLSSRSSWSGSVVWMRMWKGLFWKALNGKSASKFDIEPISELQAILDGTRVPAIEQPPLDDDAPDGDTRGTAAQRVKAERRKSRKADKEEDSREDSADQAGIVARRPRTIRSVLEKAKLLPLTATNRDGQSMVGLQKLLAFAFSVIGARAPRPPSSARALALLGSTKTSSPQRALAEPTTTPLSPIRLCLTKQKFENVFSEVWLLVRYVNTAHVYSEFENELQDKKSSEYQKYKAAVEGHKKEFGKLHIGVSRRQYILTQAVRGVFGEHGEGHRPGLSEDKQLAKSHFTKMEKLLNTALALSYLGDAFGPGIHALMIASD
ncbi:hypothetical protein D6D10_09225 [Aureobasidium pullulans]|uniref:Uncharacterized protein n=1 Tax=Aureobasidium pullulans TaxID=5580 RepID=A0A4S9E5G9_AURPU|nr:hypothetical protein D6D10_09225 [Aureobasidium pullulans]